jgi:hypothetical protein
MRDPLLAALAIAVGLFGIVNLFLAVSVPPNNYSGMIYHMARVGYYLQQASLDSFPTPNIRQTSFPANAEILLLWQVALLNSDRMAGTMQWLAGVGPYWLFMLSPGISVPAIESIPRFWRPSCLLYSRRIFCGVPPPRTTWCRRFLYVVHFFLRWSIVGRIRGRVEWFSQRPL